MNTSIIIYLLIFALGLGFSFYQIAGYLKTKIVLLCAMFYMSSAIIFSFNSYMGWPTQHEDAPDSMLLTSVVIFDKTTKSDGIIYATGIPCVGSDDVDACLNPEKNESFMIRLNPMKVFGYEPPTLNTPRIFVFPYTTENREIFSSAQQNMGEGGQSFFRRGGDKEGKEGTGGGDSMGEGEGKGSGGVSQSGEGTKNAFTEGAQNIHIDNRALRDIIKKDQPK